ncbi:methyl-accepting chemotaxis protein [Wohlfahrtiimonas chitiniclastica]|uniref:methyl-accepting chemotaxis protein n=1 Tax=Wohlfahrtiimonas chitiniclastica TaxID=400946 RepID=UPI000B9870F6|nr:methyl-accepting chemotaxis protein [Wohlfahrtiimonas chitiniclastica]OYQ75070.1 protein pilJ [Wohlfahrtiimonas chitiniclastica]
MSKSNSFFSTHIPHILCAIALVVFTGLSIALMMSQHDETYENRNSILQSQLTSSHLNEKNTVKLLNAIKSDNDEQAIEALAELQQSLQAQNQSLANVNQSLKQESDTVEFHGLQLPSYTIYILWGLAALSLLILLVLMSRNNNAVSVEDTQSLHAQQHTQQALLEFLEVIQALSEGDLTVQAQVSDDITGTLADSFNYSVEELRNLVSMVNQSTKKLSEAVGDSSTVAEDLLNASTEQARRIAEASNTLIHVTEAMIDVSDQTSSAVDIAMSSTEVARSGSERVRSTISGMDQIRDHIQETSKRIKRLGESSQEIGDIVELINDIADQTHILALNASIQAAAAGDAGRGFAVVADEIQRLAERTGNATRRVENIVKAIQTDTNEAIFAMEKSTSEVVNGANLAERAGESLNEIESVSTQLASMIQNVSKSSREVSSLGNKMKDSIDSIKKLTEQNVTSTQITNRSVEKINELANELRESISGFKIK